MKQSELIDPDWVVLTWVTRGIEWFFFSFRVSEMDRHSGFDQFLNAMGLELICKGYLLAVHRAEYKDLREKEAKEKVNSLARNWGHNLRNLIKEIKNNIGNETIQPFLEKEFRGFKQKENPHQKNKDLPRTVLSGIEAAYLESRYPVPHPFYKDKLFSVDGIEDAYFDPLCSSDIPQFCYEFCRVILTDLKEKYDICLPISWFNQKMPGDEGERFGNLLFGARKKDFFLEN